MISGKGFICIKVWGIPFADLSNCFLNSPWKWNYLVSPRPNYFIFIGYFKTGGQWAGFKPTPSWSTTAHILAKENKLRVLVFYLEGNKFVYWRQEKTPLSDRWAKNRRAVRGVQANPLWVRHCTYIGKRKQSEGFSVLFRRKYICILTSRKKRLLVTGELKSGGWWGEFKPTPSGSATAHILEKENKVRVLVFSLEGNKFVYWRQEKTPLSDRWAKNRRAMRGVQANSLWVCHCTYIGKRKQTEGFSVLFRWK